jgi:hypothetical protein
MDCEPVSTLRDGHQVQSYLGQASGGERDAGNANLEKRERRSKKTKDPPLQNPNPQGWGTLGKRQSQNLLDERSMSHPPFAKTAKGGPPPEKVKGKIIFAR